MRILLVSHRYPPFGISGVERASEQTAKDLVVAGHQVVVFTRRQSAAPPIPRLERTERDGIPVIMAAGGGALQGRFPGPEPTMERIFERTLLEVSPDVVLVSHLMGHSPLYVSIVHRWGVPIVLELHDFYIACERAHLERPSGELCRGPEAGRACAAHCFPGDDRGLERWGLRSHLFRQALERADALVCPSEFVARYFRNTFGAELCPHVIGNGVDIGRVAAEPARAAELRLACVGVVAPHKGAHVVVDALRRARLPHARLTLFGIATQPYLENVVNSAADIPGLTLRTYGAFEPRQLPALLAEVDTVIVPSLVWETYSIVSREAMACGIPVIASRLGALPEAIRDGDNGLLFDAGSATQLALILQDLDRDRARIDALVAGIRPDDWISVRDRTHRLEAIFEELLTREHPTSNAVAFDELRGVRDRLLENRDALGVAMG